MNDLHDEFNLVKLKFLSYTHSEYSSDKEVMEVIWDMAEASYRERNASNDKDYTVTEAALEIQKKAQELWENATDDQAQIIRKTLIEQGHDCDELFWGMGGTVNEVVSKQNKGLSM